MRVKLTLLCLTILAGSFLQLASAQNLQLSGIVKNKSGNEPLVGATVSVEGTTVSTVTDLNGKFSVSAPKGAFLVFSYTGMTSFR